MRYAFVSDVHGNIEALTAVLAHLDGIGFDRLIFLGDAVGYGANPNEVCDLLRARIDVGIVGNHDAAVAGRMAFDSYYDAARHALVWCQERITPTNLAWLSELPYKVEEPGVAFCHGAPVVPEVFDYLFGVAQVQDLLPAFASLQPATFIGHSHLTLSFALTENDVQAMVVPEVQCAPGHKYIVTVGSVGQPRDRDPRACCGIFDTDLQAFTYHRVSYDIQSTHDKIMDAGLAPIFAERLLLGI